jgi:hypothetical protein
MSEAEAVEKKNRRRMGWVAGKKKERQKVRRCTATHL